MTLSKFSRPTSRSTGAVLPESSTTWQKRGRKGRAAGAEPPPGVSTPADTTGANGSAALPGSILSRYQQSVLHHGHRLGVGTALTEDEGVLTGVSGHEHRLNFPTRGLGAGDWLPEDGHCTAVRLVVIGAEDGEVMRRTVQDGRIPTC